ncbi:Aminomethyltransferase folate-binding domain-containing protein [Lentinula aciculospora]|uniref:Aminomethyltransferase folate-binding domain-containing protein n=1 Tax=Lentinula aciculospora TaxID=153920 RepID=A0A9W9DF54_9AGAR|nr:Aminomethyltransferase folate-binding domain-containing protein [Lentinula aciculospora]
MAPFKLPPAIRNILPTRPSVTRLNYKSVLSVSGSQAPEFLHGILSSAIPTSTRPFFSAVLNAQGRVLYDLLVFSDHSINGRPVYLLEYDSHSSDAPSLNDLLKRYVLRAKVKIRDVSQEYDSWAAWGSEKDSEWDTERDWLFAESGAIEPVWPPTVSEEWPWGSQEHNIRDRRAVGMGHRFLVGKGDKPPQASDHDGVPQDAYNLHRILHGVPEGPIDIVPNVAFPMDSNLDVMGAVDFRKGCYVGQELTVRTYHKGVIRKRTIPVLIQPSAHKSSEPEDVYETFRADTDIKPASTAGGSGPRPRGSGKLLSNSHGIGLALLRTEHVEGVASGNLELHFTSESGTSWSVMPWWPEWWPQRRS